jgi:hypothetical protein
MPPPIGHTRAAPASRAFTIGDAMILVAAASIGFALARPILLELIRFWSAAFPGSVRLRAVAAAWYVMNAINVVVVLLAMAHLLICLRTARPSRRLMRRPGFVASLSIIGGLIPGVLNVFAGHHYLVAANMTNLSPIAMHSVGPVVAGGWLFLALSRRWRAAPTWIDRFGRTLGAYWIAYSFVLPHALALYSVLDLSR